MIQHARAKPEIESRLRQVIGRLKKTSLKGGGVACVMGGYHAVLAFKACARATPVLASRRQTAPASLERSAAA
jgi:hypothetical protein